MTTKWHEGSASSTSPRSPELEPTRSQGAPWQQGLGSGPLSRVQRGEGLPKSQQLSAECRRRQAVPTAQAPCQTRPCKVLGHSRTNQYKLLQKPPPLGMSTSSKWASAPLPPKQASSEATERAALNSRASPEPTQLRRTHHASCPSLSP